MVTLDTRLLQEAQRLINGANVRQMKQLIFGYEEAVKLHNTGKRAHRIYRAECEKKLRSAVVNEALCRAGLTPPLMGLPGRGIHRTDDGEASN